MLKWSQYTEQETITDTLDKPYAVRCVDGRIVIAADNPVGSTETRKHFCYNSEKRTYLNEIEIIEIVWSGHRENPLLSVGEY